MSNMKLSLKCSAAMAVVVFMAGCAKEKPAAGDGVPAAQEQTIRFTVRPVMPAAESEGTKIALDGSSLKWEGTETMALLIGNASTSSASAGQTASLVNTGDNTFSGQVALGSGFTVSDIRAMALPASGKAWVKTASRASLPIAYRQVQKDPDVLNGENFPLWAPVTDGLLDASRQEDGSYIIDNVELRWGCSILKFNVYGAHPDMQPGEVLESISLITDDFFPRNLEAGLSDNAISRTDNSNQVILDLKNGATLDGRTAANGVKMYMAFYPGSVKLYEVKVTTDKGIYTLKTSHQITGSDLRGHIIPFGLNLSKFERVDRAEFEYYYNAVLDVAKRSYLPSIEVTYTEPGKTISFVAVNDDFYSMSGITQETMPLNVRSVYDVASMSKPPLAYFTMKMVEEGKFDLMKPLWEYYPDILNDFATDALKEKVKLINGKMCLLHTSGLANETYSNISSFPGTPGYTDYSYSGCGVWLLSRTLAHILGTTVEDMAADFMFDKIGMTHTSYAWQNEYELCHTYGHQELAGASASKVKNWAVNIAHSLRTTTEDYTKNLKWIMSGADLTSESYNEIMSEYLTINSGHTSQGYIWRIDTLSTQGPVYHHRGSKVLFHGWMCFAPQNQVTLAFFTNGTTSFNFNQPIAKLFLGEEVYALKGHGQDLPEPKTETGTGSGSGLAGEYGIIDED